MNVLKRGKLFRLSCWKALHVKFKRNALYFRLKKYMRIDDASKIEKFNHLCCEITEDGMCDKCAE